MFIEDLVITSHKEEQIFEMMPDYPYCIRKIDPRTGRTLIVPWHWHEEVEFIYVKQGVLRYDTPKESILVAQGNGVFANSSVLHQVASPFPASQVSYEVHMFRKHFIAEDRSLLDKRYVLPLQMNDSASIILVDQDLPSHKCILDRLLRLSKLNDDKPFGYELISRNTMSEVWLDLLRILKIPADAAPSSSFSREDRLKKMLLFIHEHYMEDLSLRDISDSASISDRECLRCFQNGIHTVPFAYLQEYRIQAACNLLHSTDDTIMTVAEKCGFNSSSYFGKVFKKHMKCSPLEYRDIK